MNHTSFQKGKSALYLYYFIKQLFYILYVYIYTVLMLYSDQKSNITHNQT